MRGTKLVSLRNLDLGGQFHTTLVVINSVFEEMEGSIIYAWGCPSLKWQRTIEKLRRGPTHSSHGIKQIVESSSLQPKYYLTNASSSRQALSAMDMVSSEIVINYQDWYQNVREKMFVRTVVYTGMFQERELRWGDKGHILSTSVIRWRVNFWAARLGCGHDTFINDPRYRH